MRKTIISIVGGVLILLFGIVVNGKLSSSGKAPKRKTESTTKSVVVEKVINKTLPIQIRTTGPLVAKDRSVLYSEVQGIFTSSSKPFKPGTRFNAGDALIRVNNAEYAATVAAQRSSFKSLVTSSLADIQFDYPGELEKWKRFSNSIKVQSSLPELPSTSSEQMKYFITNKNIYSTYYNIKNLETRLRKYTIAAPFNGVLVSASVTAGTLVSPGQKLGEFIRPGVFELELNVNAGLRDFLKVGKQVSLSKIGNAEVLHGTVVRINSLVDQASQTVKLFVQINSPKLTEGEYLEATISAQEVEGVYEISRNLIMDENKVFVVNEGKLHKQTIQIIHISNNKVIVKGLKESSNLVSMPVPGGYEGMNVTIK